MADLSTTIEIIFGAVDKTGDGFRSVADGINKTAESASKVTEPLSEIAKKSLEAEAAVLALGTAFLTVAVNEADKFQNKVEEIGSLVNATPADVDKLKASIQDFAANSTSDFDQITQAVYTATSNIGDASKALDVMAVAEKGAIVGNTDLETSSALLTRTMNAYGLVTNDSATNTRNAERVMAALFTTVQNGDTTLAKLSDAVGRVASTAAAANIPIETVGAAVAALTGAGVNTDESMTLLNSLIKELLNPSKELSEALGGLSVTTSGLPAVMDKLKESTGGSAEKVYALFSSTEAAKAGLILANDSAGKFDGTIKAMDGNIDAFNKNYANMVGGVDDSTQKLANTTKILLQKVGDPLTEGWMSILDGLSAMMQGFSLSVDKGSFDPVFAAFNEFDGDISALLNQIAKNLPEALAHVDFHQLIAALKDAGFEIKDLFGDMDLSTPEGMAHAIQFLVDTFTSLTRVVAGIIDAWGPVEQGFVAGIDTFNALDDSSKKTVGNMLGLSQIFETLKDSMTTGANALDIIGKALAFIAAEGALAFSGATWAGLMAVAPELIAVAAAAYALKGAYDYYAGAEKEVANSTEYHTAIVKANTEELKKASEAAGFSITSIKQLNEAVASGKVFYDAATDSYKSAEQALKEFSNSTGINVDSYEQMQRLIDDGVVVWDKATNSYKEAAHGIRDFDAEVAAASQSGSWFADAVNSVAASLNLASGGAASSAESFGSLAEAESYAAQRMQDGYDVSVTYKDGLYVVDEKLKAVADSTQKAADTTKDAAAATVQGSKEWKNVQDVLLQTQKQLNDFNIEMAKLTLHKYEIDVKANVDLQTAQIEADTARIAAAFTSASEVIGGLTTGVTELWKLFGNKDTWDGARDDIKEAALRQEQRLDQELKLKEKLTDAVVDQARATTARLSSGAPLISIDGGNLAPELEMVFDKILKFTQIKATQQGLSMLVGLPSL